jgi:hypothetical protein
MAQGPVRPALVDKAFVTILDLSMPGRQHWHSLDRLALRAATRSRTRVSPSTRTVRLGCSNGLGLIQLVRLELADWALPLALNQRQPGRCALADPASSTILDACKWVGSSWHGFSKGALCLRVCLGRGTWPSMGR